MNFKRIVLRSYAKVNLGLHVLGKREDGYHEIRTIFQTIKLYDRLEITRTNRRKIEFGCDFEGLHPSDNLVVKAIERVSQYAHLNKGFRVHLEKRIPIGAGLGGGSSNAAAAILGIRRLLSLNLSNEDLFEMGGLLGSDVPFFFVGGKALGVGRGAEVYPLAEEPEKYLLLVIPPYRVSTMESYARVSLPLTKKTNKSMIPVFCPGYLDSLGQGNLMKNDFEKIIFHDFPKLKQLKMSLLDSGAFAAGLSGTGSALFALFNSERKLKKAQDHIRLKDSQLIETQTLGRAQYMNCITESLH